MGFLRKIISIVLKLFLALIAIYVLANALLLGGCLALGAGLRVSQIVAEGAAEVEALLAKSVPLPPRVRLLVDDDYAGWLPEDYSGVLSRPGDFDPRTGWLSQDPSGRYLLTGRGLFDFSTAAQTALTCPAPRTGLASRRWLDDRRFFWDRCVFDLATLQPGAVERVWCGAGRGSCGGDELAVALTQIIQRSDKIYYLGHDYEGYVFVDLSDTAPPHAWTEGLPFFESKETEEQVKQNRVEVPSQAGRSIARGTSRPSPDGNYSAAFDGDTLRMTRAQDGAVVAEVQAKDFHRAPGSGYQRMNVAGWTDDSRQIIFLVETIFNSRRSLAQVFALTAPEE